MIYHGECMGRVVRCGFGSILSLLILFIFSSGVCFGAAPTSGLVSCEKHGVPAVGRGGLLPGPITPGGGVAPETPSKVTPPGQTGGVSSSGGYSVTGGGAAITTTPGGPSTTSGPNTGGEIEAKPTTGGLSLRKMEAPPGSGGRGPTVSGPTTVSNCSSAKVPNAQCGVGSSKVCLPSLECDNATCLCYDARCTDPGSNCKTFAPSPQCLAPSTCQAFNAGRLCACVKPTGGEGAPPGGDIEEARFQANLDDFASIEEDLSDSQSAGTLRSSSAEGFLDSPSRANRGGAWYHFYEDYPGYLVNILPSAVGKELQIYLAGERHTYSALGNDRYRLVSEEDRGGNVTWYEYDAGGRLVRKKLPLDILVEYVYQASGFVLQVSRCAQPNYQSCSLIEDQTYTYNPAGQLIRVTGAPLAYVDEPTGGGVHNVSALRSDRVSYLYEYYPSNGKLWKISVERGVNQALIAEYRYYPSGVADSGKLHQTVDGRGNTTTYTYQSNRVTATDNFGAQVSALFDSADRIVEYRTTPNPAQAGGVPYTSTRVAYAGGSDCDKVVRRLDVDPGDGTYRNQLEVEWDTFLYRILSVSSPGPNGNTNTVTYSDFTHVLDGNEPQEVTTPLGTAKTIPEFVAPADPTDSRFKVASKKSLSIPVADINGVETTEESVLRYTATGQVDSTVSNGLQTKYYYAPNGLLRQVDSGPEGSSGVPDMSDPAAYSVQLTRDPVTGRVVSSSEGQPGKRKVISYTYTDNVLTAVRDNGGGRAEYYYNWLGEFAATRAYAVDENGNPFGGKGRTWQSTHTVRDALGRVLYTANDVADPRLGTPEYRSTQYFYNAAGLLEKVVPWFGDASVYLYDGWGEVKEVRRGSSTGTLEASFTRTPFSETVQRLSGESNGQLTYVSTTHTYSSTGYLDSVTSSLGRSARFTYDDLGRLLTSEGYVGGTRVAKFGVAYDTWGREIESLRFNPVTDAMEVLSRSLYAGSRLQATYDRFGNATNYQYGVTGELLSISNVLSKTSYEYVPQGGVVSKVTTESGTERRVFGYDYDALGRAVAASDLGDGTGKGVVTKTRYTSLGQPVITGPDGRTPYAVVGSDGRIWASGLKDELDVTYGYELDSQAGRYAVTKKVKGEGRTKVTYGSFGPVSVEDADGRRQTINYTRAGTIASITAPDGSVMTPSYNANGEALSASIQNGATLEQWVTQRDALQRPYELTKTVTDPSGTRTSVRRVTEFGEYSELKKVEVEEPGRTPVVTGFDYTHPSGQYIPELSSKVTVGGATWAREVDLKTGRLNAVELSGGAIANPLRFEVGYNGAIQSSLKYPSGSGLESSWEYDRGRLARVAIEKGSQPVGGAEFKRNPIGQVTQIIELNGLSGLGKAFKYVGDRLTAAKEVSQFGATYERTQGQNESTISYDGTNPQQRKRVTPRNGTPIDYVVDGTGRYLSIGGLVPQYDTLGRVTSLGDYTYRYEGTNLNPVEVQRLGVVVRKFGYDLHGNLIRTTDSSGRTTEYVKSGTVDIGELDAATGELVKAFVTFPNGQTPREKIASVDLKTGAATYFTHTGPFTPFAAHDAQGNIQERYDTRFAEGRLSIAAPNGAVRRSSAVGREDGFHGLHHFADAGPFGGISITPARTLVPAIGFFLAPDPLNTTAQKYTYADNNPVTMADPTGLQAPDETLILSITDGLQSSASSGGDSGPGFWESIANWFNNAMASSGQGYVDVAKSQQAMNAQITECVYETDWTDPKNSWLTNTAIATGQKVVQGVGIATIAAPVAIPAGVLLVTAAPVAGPAALTGLGFAGGTFGAGVTAHEVFTEGLTPDNTADAILIVPIFIKGTQQFFCLGRKLFPVKVPELPASTPARDAAKTVIREVDTAAIVSPLPTGLCGRRCAEFPSIQLDDYVRGAMEEAQLLYASKFFQRYGAFPRVQGLSSFIGDMRWGRIGPQIEGVYLVRPDGAVRMLVGDPNVAKHILAAENCLDQVIIAGEFRAVAPNKQLMMSFDNVSGSYMKSLSPEEQVRRMTALQEMLNDFGKAHGIEPGSLWAGVVSAGGN